MHNNNSDKLIPTWLKSAQLQNGLCKFIAYRFDFDK